MLVRAAFAIAVLVSVGLHPAAASERLLKLRQYTFACGTAGQPPQPGQECVGWRHTFAYLDPAARNAELPRDTYTEVYTAREVDELIDLREREIKAEVEQAMAKRGDGAVASLSEDDRRRFRDEIAAEVVAQMARMMAEHETQTRAWLRELVREEMRAAAPPR